MSLEILPLLALHHVVLEMTISVSCWRTQFVSSSQKVSKSLFSSYPLLLPHCFLWHLKLSCVISGSQEGLEDSEKCLAGGGS